MVIAEKNKIIYLDLDVYEDDILIESTEDSELFSYIHGRGTILPKLESSIDGHKEGYESEITLNPEDAFGLIDKSLTTSVSKEMFPDTNSISIGSEYKTNGPNGTISFVIKEINDDDVILDGNHPLAGKSLTFHFRVNTIKDAHKDEIRHARVHPAGHNIMVEDSSWLGEELT
jgi:FKBP-type peptidyl-prolyl cis-trans isomerase SlyD